MNQEKATLLPIELETKNNVIKQAYFDTIKDIGELSKSFPNPNLRIRIEIDRKHYPGEENEVFELLTSYVYLLLITNEEGQFKIGYAVNDFAVAFLGQAHFTKLIRIIYSNTVHSKADIQDCLEVFPYHSDIYKGARHVVGYHEEIDEHYKLIQEEFKGQ